MAGERGGVGGTVLGVQVADFPGIAAFKDNVVVELVPECGGC